MVWHGHSLEMALMTGLLVQWKESGIRVGAYRFGIPPYCAQQNRVASETIVTIHNALFAFSTADVNA